MKNVVSSVYYSKGMLLGRLADWNPDRVPGEPTCNVHIRKASTTRIKRRGLGAALLDASLRVNPSPLRLIVHQDREGGGRNALIHLTHPRLRESPTQEDVPKEVLGKRVIGLRKVYLPRKTGGANSTLCCYNLLRQHEFVCHLLTRNRGILEHANHRWKYIPEPINQHLCED